MQILIGFIAGTIISLAALQARSLSNSGAVAASVTGTLIFGIGGWPWATLLLTFFITSSALSKAFRKRKTAINEKFAKGNQRDWAQVLANDGIGTLLVLFLIFEPEIHWVWIAYAGAMATVNADTWATELGVLNPKPPHLITTGKTVEPGTSGGISFLGTLATLGGALMIGLVGAAFSVGRGPWILVLAATLGGVCGSLFDSLLGATVQAIYYCPACIKETERHPFHSCGDATTQVRGWSWLNNDVVNLLASALGAAIAFGIWSLYK